MSTSAVTLPGVGDCHGVITEVGHRQRLQQFTAIGVRVGTHAALAGGRELGELLAEFAMLVE